MHLYWKQGGDTFYITGHVIRRIPPPALRSMGAEEVLVGKVDSIIQIGVDGRSNGRWKREFETARRLLTGRKTTWEPFCPHDDGTHKKCPHHCKPTRDFTRTVKERKLILRAFKSQMGFIDE